MKEVVREVTSGLGDLSISRPVGRLSWGVRVPGDDSQTIYVWVDALINYITYAGYPFHPGEETSKGWPADVQVIGKDIVRYESHVDFMVYSNGGQLSLYLLACPFDGVGHPPSSPDTDSCSLDDEPPKNVEIYRERGESFLRD